MSMEERTASEIFKKLDMVKSQVLNTARLAARLTIPTLLPPAGHNQSSDLPRPTQGTGARAVNTLGAKLLLALFPTNTSFFKWSLTRDAKEELGDEEVTQYQKQLSRMEADTVSLLEKSNFRSTLSIALKYLPALGDACIRVDKEGKFRVYRLDSYVVDRDSTGAIIDLVVKESSSFPALPTNIQMTHFNADELKQLQEDRTKEVEIYTHMYRDKKKFRVYQEVNGKKVEGSEGHYPLDAPEFVVARWSYLTGEDYGRGMVEDYLSDFIALESYSNDMRKASAAAAKVIFAIATGSQIMPKDLSTAESGDVIRGNADDVSTISIDKSNDFRVTMETKEEIKRGLEQVFLMNSSVTRQAERVTAEEIRYLAQELEDALGGVYSILSQELQTPLLNRYVDVLQAQGKIPKLPAKGVEQQITTGLEALGRGHEVNKLTTFLQQLKLAVGEEAVLERINVGTVATKLATGIGIEADGLIKDDEVVQQEQAQKQQEQMAQGIAPGAAQELIKQQGQ